MKERLKRVTALVLAVLILVTTCFTGLPDGSLSFLGDFGSQVASLFEQEDVTAAQTVKIYLSKQYKTFGISEISRVSSEGLWFFGVGSKSGTPVFCENSGAANCGASYDTYTAYKTDAEDFDDEYLAKVMTWYFGTLGQGSYKNSKLGTLSAKNVRIAVQAYVWARCTDGASITTTITQALTNASVSSASSWASAIVSAVSGTSVYGKVIEYECSKCTRSKSLSKHQVMLGWEYDEIEPTKAKLSDSLTDTVTEYIRVEITKTEGNTGKSNKIDGATFKIQIDGKNVSSFGSVEVVTGSYTKSKSTCTTTNGKFVAYVKRTSSKITVKSGTYWYVSDPGTYSGTKLKQWMAENGVDYEDEASARAQMNKDLKDALAKEKSSWLSTEHTWTVTETKSPDGFSLPATTKKQVKEGSSYTAQSKSDAKSKPITFSFTDKQYYARVKIDKDRDTSVDVDTGSYATLKGAEYTVYAAEDIVSYESGKKVEYKKGAAITTFSTTTASGNGASGYYLPAGYKYYIQETKAPTGYQLKSTKTYFAVYYDSDNGYRYKVKIDGEWSGYYSGRTVDLASLNLAAFNDKPTYVQIRVCKAMEDFEITKVSGSSYYTFTDIYSKETAKFDIIDTATGKTVDTLTIKASGTKEITKDGITYGYDTSIKLPVGKYKIVQTSGPKMTSFVSSWTYDASTLTKTKTVKTYYKTNSLKQSGHVVVYKRKNVGGEYSAETDAEFTLYVKDGSNWRVLGKLTYINNTSKAGYGYYVYGSKNSDGTVSWTDLPVGHGSTRYTYKVVQTDGDTSVSWMEDQTFQFDYTENPTSKKTYTKKFTVTDGAAMIEVHKDKTYVDADGETQSLAESGAVFYVFKSTSGSSCMVHDYSKNASTGKITILSSTITVDKLMEKLADSDRAAYLEALKAAYPSLFVEQSVLTTDADGDAEGELGAIDGDTYFIVMQASGDDGYALADPYTFMAEDKSKKIYYYDAKDPKYQTEVDIYKTTRELAEDGETEVVSAEAGAVFAVLRAGQISGTSAQIVSELKDKDASERMEYVYALLASATGKTVDVLEAMSYADVAALAEGLSVTDAVASIIITDEEGRGYDVIDCDSSTEEFVVVQIVGEDGYDLADPDSFTYGYVDGLSSSENEDGDATESFSFEWTDPARQTTIEVTKTMTDSLGNNEEPEQGAQFYILKDTVLDDAALKAQAETLAKAQAEEEEEWEAGELLDTLSYLDADRRLEWSLAAAEAGYSLGTVETDPDGEGKLTWLNCDWAGGFVILQTYGESGYSILDAALSTDASKVTVDTGDEYNTIYSFKGTDKGPGAYLYVYKKFQSGDNEWQPESGAKFDVYDDRNEKVAEIETDADGIGYAVLPGTDTPAKLPAGNIYTIVNTASGAKNVSLAADGELYIYPADACKDYGTVDTLKADGVGVTLGYTVQNEANEYQVIVSKVSADTGEPVNGAAYEITVLDAIHNADGTILYPAGTVMDTLVMGQNDSLADKDNSTEETVEGTTEEPVEEPESTITAETASSQEPESQEEQTDGESVEATEDGEEESEEPDHGVGEVTGEDGGASEASTPDSTPDVTGDGTAYTYLPYGTYALTETYSPEGFVTSEETVYFRIDWEGITYFTIEETTDELTGETTSVRTYGDTTPADYDDGSYVYSVQVSVDDEPVYGKINVAKTGDALGLTSYDEDDMSFSYSSIPLEGVVFAVYAASDITDDAGNIVKYVGTDGNVHEMTAVAQNDTTATPIAYVTTDADGKGTFEWTKVIQYGDDKGSTATTDQFYLGNYWVVEVSAPYGWVVDTEWRQATLTTSVVVYDSESSAVEDTGSAHGNSGPYESTGLYILTTGENINTILLSDELSGVESVVFTTAGTAAYMAKAYLTSSSGSASAQSYYESYFAYAADVSADSDTTVVLYVLNSDTTTAYIAPTATDQVVYLNAVSGSMFKGCSWLESIEFGNVDTSLLEDMSYMFYGCTGLTFLDLSDWNTTNVGWVQYAFAGCSNLTTVWVEGIEWTVDDTYTEGALVEIRATANTTFMCEYDDASGRRIAADEIHWDDFQYTACYQQSYLSSYLQQEIELTEDDIADITPDIASEDYAPDGWKEGDDDSFTMTVTITLDEGSDWYCTDGTRSNEIVAEITVRCVDKIDADADKTEHPEVTITVDDKPATMNVRMRKMETGQDTTLNTVEGATFVLYANVDILDIDGNVIVKAGTEIGRQESAGDGFDWSEFYYLPSSQYAGTDYQSLSDGTYNIGFTFKASGEQDEADGISSGNYMYKVVEIPPSGYDNYTINGKEVVWYFSGDLSGVELTTAGDLSMSYNTYAANTQLDYITVEKIWDDMLNAAGERPAFVMMKASGSGSVYYIVMTEETTYLIKQPTINGTESYNAYNNLNNWFNGKSIPTLSQLVAYASYSKPTTVLTDEGYVQAGSETETWRVVLDNSGWTALDGSGDFVSPFTKDSFSSWTFSESIALVKAMRTKLGNDTAYQEEFGNGDGSSDSELGVWRAKNVYAPAMTSASVQKTWTDDSNENGYRPDSLVVQLYRKAESESKWTKLSGYKETLTENVGWTHATDNVLESQNEAGEDYEYMWQEVEAYDSSGTYYYTFEAGTDGVKRMYVYDNSTDELAASYLVSEDYSYNAADDVWETTAENKLNSKEASVEKAWEDAGEEDIPDDTYVTLWAWADTEGTGEPPVDDIRQWTQVDLSGEATASYTAASTLTGNETDTAIALNSGNSWAATVKNLPKYYTSGGEDYDVYYMFQEAQAGDTSVVDGTLLTLDADWLDHYEAAYDGGGTTLLTKVTNTFSNWGKITASKKILEEDLDRLAVFDEIPEFTFTLTWQETDKSTGITSDKESSVTFVFATEADYADKAEAGVTYIYLADGAEADADGYLTLSYTWEELAYGTYAVTESGGEAWYELTGIQAGLADSVDEETKSAVFTISRENVDYELVAEFTNTLRTGMLEIRKLDTSGNGLADVEFTVTASDGTVVAEGLTDGDGSLTFYDIPIGTYTLAETSTVDGYSLLAEPVEVTMPLVLTDEEIAEYAAKGISVNTSGATEADGKYYFYTLSYEVTDTVTFNMPPTGGSMTAMAWAAVIIGFAAVILSMMSMRYKRRARRKKKAAA